MSIGRNHADFKDVRDVNADYINAYLAEYERFVSYGREDMAELVAKELRALGHEVKPKTAPAKEHAVSPEPLERAVEQDEPPKRGRPRKSAE